MDETRTPIAAVAALWCAGLVAALQFAKMSVGFDALAVLHPQAGARLGLAVSLISFIGVVLGAVAGMLVGQIGFRRVLIAAMALAAVISAFQAFEPGFGILLASRAVEGLSHLAIVVAAPTLIVQLTAKRHLAFVISLWGTFFGVGFALAGLVGPALLGLGGLRALFLAHAAAAMTVGVALLLVLPSLRRVQQPRPTLTQIIERHVAIYRSPFTNAAGLGWLFYTLTFVSSLTLLPRIAPPELSRLLATALPLISIGAALTLGVACLRWLGALWTTVIGFAGGALAMVAASLGLAGPGFMLLALCWGIVQSGSFALVPTLNGRPEDQALANGALAQMGNLGNLLGTPLLLILLIATGPRPAIVVLALLFATAALLHLWLARKRSQQNQP